MQGVYAFMQWCGLEQQVNSYFIEESQHGQVIMLNGLAQNSRIKISSYFDYLSQRVVRL